VKIQYVAMCNWVRDFWGRTAIFGVIVWAVNTICRALRERPWHLVCYVWSD